MIKGLKVREYNSSREGITRLILGGLHGREHKVSNKILDMINPGSSEGRVVIIPNLNISGRKYMSTLDKNYIKSPIGRIYLWSLNTTSPMSL